MAAVRTLHIAPAGRDRVVVDLVVRIAVGAGQPHLPVPEKLRLQCPNPSGLITVIVIL
jgi:hypothetical protein